MNILLVSQCKKNALKQTRRLIDQFAERCGERTWQTAITQEGLATLHALLRRTARKNTAVACYWTRGKNQTELVWIVGDRSQFNDQGRVPTNRTKRNILRNESENHWQYGTSMQIMATLAALLHDLGKSTLGFQNKLKGEQKDKKKSDPYRHEWISLKLLMLMLKDCNTNEQALTRLANFAQYQQENLHWFQELTHINDKDKGRQDLSTAPSLVQWLAWLIVSHHRMPICQNDQNICSANEDSINQKKQNAGYVERFTPHYFFKELAAFEGWVKNATANHANPAEFWQLADTVTTRQLWLSQLKRWATKALNDPNLRQLGQEKFITNPFLLHLSRLALMTGDHNFSSLSNQRQIATEELIANTDSTRHPKQSLEEHLIGVARYTARFARLLPLLTQQLPCLSNHKSLVERTKHCRFMWQNYAYDLAKSVNEQANEVGFFGVNMASTGCGKTLANGRIMYALANAKRGARFTIALGLRVLTLQTGNALRQKLKLDQQQLAILVGGQAMQTLFELTQQTTEDPTFEKESTELSNKKSTQQPSKESAEEFGKESSEELVDGFVDASECGIDSAEFGTLIEDKKARSLLLTPLVTCTVDQLIQASENKRGGKHIVPILRLLTSDLILDEPDDFDQNDLPALARLVHLAGLFGSKVLLSSATLTPDLINGLFNAYQAGRKIWQTQQQKTPQPIVCGWFDEFHQEVKSIATSADFNQAHEQFIHSRVLQLAQAVIRRKGIIMPQVDYVTNKPIGSDLNYPLLTAHILEQAYRLHDDHHNIDPQTNQKVSLGLIRLAHTKDVIELAYAMYQQTNLPQDRQLHIVVYHARQLLFLRSKLEEKLDRILNRNDPDQLFSHAEIRQRLDHSSRQHHLFIVIGTPVTEVGRDHDYDWAIIEPSSMRSIIQLVGRVWRHRPDKVANTPNVALLCSNINAMKKEANNVCFCKPGFESTKFPLTTHKSEELITEEQLTNINAIPRIKRPIEWQEKINQLAELEHQVMANLFNIAISDIKKNSCTSNKKNSRTSNEVTSYWQDALAHPYCVHLQLLTPFRLSEERQIEYVCQFNEDNEPGGLDFSLAESAWQTPNELCEQGKQNKKIRYQSWQSLLEANTVITPWLTVDFAQELQQLNQRFPDQSLPYLALQFSTVTLQQKTSWRYHPWFGFYQNVLKL